MILAAVGFGDPLMLAGLVAALVPVVLHLLNRMNAPVMAFPTLRFLKITAHKTARRRQIQQYFLLLVRVVVFALVAMAVAGPLIRGGSAMLAYGMVGVLLAGLALLVVAGVWGTAALSGGQLASKPVEKGRVAVAKKQPARGGYGVLAAMAGIVAILLLGFGVHALTSDRYFSQESAGEFSGRSTAMVVVLDNSYSMLLREDSVTRLQRAKEEVRQLLGGGGEAVQPAEAAILPTNPGENAEGPALSGDLTRLLGTLDRIQAQGSARPMQERIRTALEMLQGSGQANKMLVIASDFARPAFSDAEVFAALKGIGWRKDLQVVLMPMRAGRISKDGGANGAASGAEELPGDVGIASFTLAEGSVRPVVGAEMVFEAQIINNGDAAEVREFALTVDGNVVGAQAANGVAAIKTSIPPTGPPAQRVQLGAAGTANARATLRIGYRLAQPGWHRFGLQMINAQDAMEWDDKRELALEVAEQVKVMVIGAEGAGGGAGPRVRSAAFYFEAALAPFGTGARGEATPWSIAPVYRGMGEVSDVSALNGYVAVYLCDLPQVPVPLANALARYVRAGGRVVWVLGPSVDAAAYNQVLLGQNRNLLPAPLGEPHVLATASPLEWVDMHSGVFTNLFDNQDPFRSVLVTGRWTFAGNAHDISGTGGKVLGKLAGDEPLFTQHSVASDAGGGRVYTLLTTPAAAWSNLGATVVLVPMASRMALGDFADDAASGNPLSVDAGRGMQIRIAGVTDAAAGGGLTVDVTTPAQAIINVKPLSTGGNAGGSGTAMLWPFDRTYIDGAYLWKSSDGRHEGMFVVNPPAEEADLYPADVEALAKESSPGIAIAGKPTLVAAGSKDLLRQLRQRGEGTSLAPGFLAMVLMLAVVEAMMANRHRAAGGN